MKLLTFSALFLSLVSSMTFADTHVDKRQENQAKRIEEGINSGKINQAEEAKLEQGQARVEEAEAKVQADGKTTRKEKRHLNRMQNRQSKKIHRMKHNN
jgi:hypothetical protein